MEQPNSTVVQAQGRRICALRDALHRALKLSLVVTDFEDFRELYPSLPEDHIICAYDAYAQVLHMIRSHSQAEFEDIAEEAQLLSKLSDLEQLCEEQGIAADGTQQPSAGQPAVQPSAIARRYRVQAKSQERDGLTQELLKYKQFVAELEAKVAAKHVEVLERAAEFQPIADRLAAVREASIQWASRSVEQDT